MRDRLIGLIKHEICVDARDNGEFIETRANIEEIADYLLANGVIVPPCKVGDTVYSIIGKNVQPFVVVCSNIQLVAEETSFEYKAENGEYPMYFGGRDIDKTVFLTREEAERALKGGAEE